MIPLQLTIEGIYSYQNKQTIDFSELIEAGLFGIFGAVGSGKSSILEAISFALYGETERLNARDKRAYNMMNLKSNRSYIEFDFINFENKKFRATREFKRNSKKFEDVKSPLVVFYKWVDENWIPLEHSNAEQIIGLSYENFKRTIIIPQGQFKEFIELGVKDRTQMMKEIFNLHRFDLQDKVASLNKVNQSNIDQLDGKLSGFETVSEEHINELNIQLIELSKKAVIIQNEYQIENEKFQQVKLLKSDFENLNIKKSSFAQLVKKKPIIDAQKVQLDQYELIYTTFNQLLINQHKFKNEIVEKSTLVENQQKQLILLENQLKEISNQINSIQSQFEILPDKRKKEADLELLVQILIHSKEIIELKERTKNGQSAVEEVKMKEQSINDLIKLTEIEIQQLVENKIDSQVLMEAENWFTKNQGLIDSTQKLKEKINQLQNNKSEISQQLIDQKIDVANFEQNFALKIDALEVKKKQFEKQKTDLEVQQKIAHYVHNLHDGEACPLCGSLDHPHVVEINDVVTEIEVLAHQIIAIEDEFKSLQQKKNEVHQLLSKKEFFEDLIKQEKELLVNLEDQIKSHFNLFVWKEFDANEPADFTEKKKASLLVEQTINDKHKLVAEQRAVLENERINLDKYQNKLEELKSKEVEKSAQIQQNQSNLKFLKFEDFKNESVEAIQEKLIELKANNQKLESDYTLYNQQLNENNLKFAAQKSSIEVTQKYIDDLRIELKECEEKITESLVFNSFSNVDEVQNILALDLNVTVIRKQIEDYRISYETLKNSINELEQKFKDITFDENLYKNQEIKFNEVSLLLNEANEIVTKTKAEVDRLSKSFEEKKDLLKEMETLKQRATNLQTLRNLFNSAGFVQYVSSIYLKQLCENANIRFHRMTRNQLSLQINENNDFEIIDYLNEGRSRSVKTLSGGQAFQVSLSLALALAESVQSNAIADRNFFFIDEGFGTQDQESINIVFETLNNLHKENRIVGIISHVEELKERIPMALSITKDEDKGSQIEIN